MNNPAQKIVNFFTGRGNKVVNGAASTGVSGSDFLRYGSQRRMTEDWSKVSMSDVDFYTGYSYAAINNRANKVAQIAISNLKTDATSKIQEKFRGKDEDLIHPYLDLINYSDNFTNTEFWYNISTYLDLEGVYYLMAVRAVSPTLIGEIQSFTMLNPYNIKKVRSKDTGEVGGYIERRDGMIREIPKEMIIEVRKLNPFESDVPFAMTDAAKESQYTMKQASDYTRSSLKNNITAPGIIGTDVLLEDEEFANFRARIVNQEKGTPLFGNGSGAVTWEPMQIDMDKAALADINEINRSTLFAVSGVSKTTMGLEESGTTRETSRTQRDKFVEDHIMPQLQSIIDAFNLDYRKYYKPAFTNNKFTIYIDSPLAADKESELKDVEISAKSFELYTTLVNQGYTPELASQFVSNEITLIELGAPTLEPKLPPVAPTAGEDKVDEPVSAPADSSDSDKKKADDKKKTADDKKKKRDNHLHEIVNRPDMVQANNELSDDQMKMVAGQSSSLLNTVTNIEATMVNTMLSNITSANNAFEEQSDVIKEQQRQGFINELALVFGAYYLNLFPIYGNYLMNKRMKEYGTQVSFVMTAEIRNEIQSIAKKAALSHVDTVVNDIFITTKNVYLEMVNEQVRLLIAGGATENEQMYALARKKALEGASQQQIIQAIKNKYTEISNNRAKTIATTETNRAFSQSQYRADIQFLMSSNLMDKAYKKLETRPGACSYCTGIASGPAIPFEQNFAEIGDELKSVFTKEDGTTVVKKMTVNYEAVSAGNVHVNCGCRYVLIIK
jgi:hypothetical protein